MKKVKIVSNMPLGNQVYFKRLREKLQKMEEIPTKINTIKKSVPSGDHSASNQKCLNNIHQILRELRNEIERRNLSK